MVDLGCEVGAIANSLVFECDGSPLLVMASGELSYRQLLMITEGVVMQVH